MGDGIDVEFCSPGSTVTSRLRDSISSKLENIIIGDIEKGLVLKDASVFGHEFDLLLTLSLLVLPEHVVDPVAVL